MASRSVVCRGADRRGHLGRKRDAHIPRRRRPVARVSPEDLATPEAFARDPRLVWEWYDWRRGLHRAGRAQPRPPGPGANWTSASPAFHAHHPERRRAARSRRQPARTQGPRRHLDGPLHRLRAPNDGTIASPLPELPPRCGCGGMLRPGVVWFGEPLPEDVWHEAERAARQAEVFHGHRHQRGGLSGGRAGPARAGRGREGHRNQPRRNAVCGAGRIARCGAAPARCCRN